MKKKLVYAVIIAAAVTLAVIGVATALFSMRATGPTNTMQAGTVEVLVTGDPVVLSGVAPGDKGIAEFQVENIGTLPVYYTVKWETTGALFEGVNPVELWSASEGRLQPGQTNTIAVQWLFPEQSGNEYQGASGTFTLVINAQQDVEAYP